MTRSFNNTLLFESALDSIDSSNTLLYSIVQTLFQPSVTIIEEDCQTLLGRSVPLIFRAQGNIELETGLALNATRITQLINAGKREVATRGLETCISEGGVCRKCINASYRGLTVPAVGYQFKVLPQVILDVAQKLMVSGITTTTLPYSASDYTILEIYQAGQLLASDQYSIVNKTLTFNTPVGSDTILVFKFIVRTNNQYYSWVADTFSGSLLGIKQITKSLLPIRKELLLGVIPSEDIDSLVFQLKQSPAKEEDCVVYLDSIRDPLERAVFAVLLGTIFLGE